MTLVLFLIILGVLIFVHELGHFLAAKRAGIRVDEFGLGFPPRVFGKKIGETTYSLNIVPFGGFVKIFGEIAEPARTAECGTEAEPSYQDTAASDAGRRFDSKSRWVQALVLSSGVLGNIIFAWLLISVTFLTGVPSSAEGRYANEITDAALTITSVLPDSPAGQAGLRAGDKIFSLSEGDRVFTGSGPNEASRFIGETEGSLLLKYGRGSETHTVEVRPARGIVEGKQAIGVSLDTVGEVRFGFFRSLFEGLLTVFDLLLEVTKGLVGFIGQAFRGEADLNALTGPVGIAGMVGEARILGFVYLLSFTAFISINLAVINLLPFPALDGGRLLFLAIEGAARRSIPPRATRILNSAGFALLLLLMAVITYRDIAKLF